MTDYIHHSNTSTMAEEISASTAHHPEKPADGGNVRAILASSNRIVLKNGRLSGGRACALSARAASRTAIFTAAAPPDRRGGGTSRG